MLPKTKQDTRLIKVLKKVYCFFKGHFYRPAYLHNEKGVQYTCCRCGTPTKFMKHKEHLIFNIEQCPTWGEPGSDSQDYRSMTLEAVRAKPTRRKRDRKRRNELKRKR